MSGTYQRLYTTARRALVGASFAAFSVAGLIQSASAQDAITVVQGPDAQPRNIMPTRGGNLPWIKNVFETAEVSYARGVELMQLRAKLLAESKRDQERAIQMASILSFEQTGSRATGPSPEALMIPENNRSTSPMWRSLRRKGELNSGNASLPGWKNTFRTKPLPDDLYKPLELPIPPQFDEGINMLEWCIVRAALVYGTESDEFKSFLIKAKKFVEKTHRAKATR